MEPLESIDLGNFLMGYLGAILIILARLNKWKDKLDEELKLTSLSQFLPKLHIWVYQNLEDWLLAAIFTPIMIMFQIPIIYLLARSQDYMINGHDANIYAHVDYLISFLFGAMSQTVAVTMSTAFAYASKKIVGIIKKFSSSDPDSNQIT